MGLRSAIARIFAARQSSEPADPFYQRVPWTGRTLAGIAVTPDTAVTVPAVWACLRYLSQTVAVLPWFVLKEGKNGGERNITHPVATLLGRRPSPEWSSMQFRETLTHWALRWGNGYAEIERDAIGRPAALWPIHPERVEPRRDPATGKLFYSVQNGVKPSVDIAAEDMFHLRGFGEGPVGVNVMQYAAESIGWARAAMLFGAAFFGNGMTVSGVVETKRPLDEPGMRRLMAKLGQLYRGARNANRVAILDADMSYKAVGIEPDKAQFLGTNQHLVQEICRWFGVPPHKVADLSRGTFANIESQSIEVVVDSIFPWVKRFEEEADFKLFGANRPGFYTRMSLTALLRGDSAARAAFYKTMREMGVYSANRILQLEDENTIGPDGDKLIVQSNMTTLDKIGQDPPPPPPGHNGGPPLEETPEETEQQRAAARARFERAFRISAPTDLVRA